MNNARLFCAQSAIMAIEYGEVGRFYGDMKEKDLYSDLLEQIKANAKEYYGNRLLFTQKEAAVIMGCSVSTINRYGLHTLITCEQLARAFA